MHHGRYDREGEEQSISLCHCLCCVRATETSRTACLRVGLLALLPMTAKALRRGCTSMMRSKQR